jgi:hypothetical protein
VVGFFAVRPCTPGCPEGKTSVAQPQPHEDDGLIELIEALQSVDTSSPLSKLNATTIADNNGGRIEL